MHAIVRHYENATALSDAMSARKQDVMAVLTAIPGFISYLATKDGDSMTSITICETEAACEESNRAAREWVKANVQVTLSPPVINGGDVFLNFSK